MTEFDKVLEECLYDVERGAASVEECLLRYPTYAPELEPVLLTTAYLERAREVNISERFRARVRTKLIQEMHAHPRKPARSGFLFTHGTAGLVRLATGLAVIILALLAAGTTYAQSALPGEMFYPWKLTSENTWRAISPDPVGTDLAIAERRKNELIAVSHDLALYMDVLKAYIDVTDRLRLEMNPKTEALIREVLETQIIELKQSGIILPQPTQEAVPSLEESTSTPPLMATAIPLPILETPQIEPTRLPQIVPTIQVPSEPTIDVPPVDVPPVQDPPQIIPTVETPPVQDLPRIVPTIEIPSLLP